jgi:hypothetical protein
VPVLFALWRSIVRGDGEIIGHELHPPFAYLLSLESSGRANESSGSDTGNTISSIIVYYFGNISDE